MRSEPRVRGVPRNRDILILEAPTCEHQGSTRRWRAEMYVEEAPTILFIDSPPTMARPPRRRRRQGGRPSFAVLSPVRRAPRRSRRDRGRARFKIGHLFRLVFCPPATAGMRTGWRRSQAATRRPSRRCRRPELRATLGYADYDAAAKPVNA